MVLSFEETQDYSSAVGIPHRLDHPLHHDGTVHLRLSTRHFIPVQHWRSAILHSDGAQYYVDSALLLEEKDRISLRRHPAPLGRTIGHYHSLLREIRSGRELVNPLHRVANCSRLHKCLHCY